VDPGTDRRVAGFVRDDAGDRGLLPHPDVDVVDALAVLDRERLRAARRPALPARGVDVAALRGGQHERSRAQAANHELSVRVRQHVRRFGRIHRLRRWQRRTRGRDDDAGDRMSSAGIDHASAGDRRRAGVRELPEGEDEQRANDRSACWHEASRLRRILRQK
jgi:hypothetical protein